MALLRNRIIHENRGADGKKIPPLPSKQGWFWTGKDDPRFPKLKPRRRAGDPPDGPSILVDKRGYRGVKLAIGAKPQRDGMLTGTMWDSLTPQLKVRRRDIRLRLYFAGVDKAQKRTLKKDGQTVRTKSGRVAKRSFRNRDKAAYLQTSGQGLKGRVLFSLMELSQAEQEAVRDIILKNIRLR